MIKIDQHVLRAKVSCTPSLKSPHNRCLALTCTDRGHTCAYPESVARSQKQNDVPQDGLTSPRRSSLYSMMGQDMSKRPVPMLPPVPWQSERHNAATTIPIGEHAIVAPEIAIAAHTVPALSRLYQGGKCCSQSSLRLLRTLQPSCESSRTYHHSFEAATLLTRCQA